MTEIARIVQIFSPSRKASAESSQGIFLRVKQPSPEKDLAVFTTALHTIPCPANEGREVESQFEINLGKGEGNEALQRALTVTKHVLLERPLVIDGLPSICYKTEELLGLFPHTFGFEIGQFLTLRVRELPPKPWPLTVGGLPLHVTTDEHKIPFSPGESGTGRALSSLNLKKQPFSLDILHLVVTSLEGLGIDVRSVVWFGGMWVVSVPEGADLVTLPSRIFSCSAFYVFTSEVSDICAFSSRVKTPKGVVYDDTLYATAPDSLLRPGIMLASSRAMDGTYKVTSSGVLVTDSSGDHFVTVATHGFDSDGLVFHPNPEGVLIGKIVKDIPGADISLVRVQKGLRYINEAFGTMDRPGGTQITRVSSCTSPDLRIYDNHSMNNPYSGQCDGLVLGFGEIVEKDKGVYIKHLWSLVENGKSPVAGSCGSPIYEEDNGNSTLIGFFRYRHTEEDPKCYLAVAATCLTENGYTLRDLIHTFDSRYVGTLFPSLSSDYLS